MERISRLRLQALTPTINYDQYYYYFYKHYVEHPNSVALIRYAEALAFAFDSASPCIAEDELIVGRAMHGMTAVQQQEWNTLYAQEAERIRENTLIGQDSHMAVNYDLLLKEGIYGILARIDSLRMQADADKQDFYRACEICLRAVVRHSERYAHLAEQQAEVADNNRRRAELQHIAAVCRRVPEYPASDFHEAVQAVHFVTFCLTIAPFRMVWQQFQLGHPDRYLLPYYQKDIDSGALTREQAQLLLDCLGIQINNRVPNGLSSGYMVGGRDENGAVIANELTTLCMQVVDDIRLVYPAVGLCMTQDTPDEYLETACCILSHGCSHPAIFNDDIITKGLMTYGVPADEAHNYIHSTCVEITPVGSSNVWVASPYTNLAQLLLDTLDREYADFESLLAAVFKRLDASIRHNYEEQKALRLRRAAHSVNPLLSCFVKDCLAKGVDIEQGGARYNWIMPSFVGMANLVDSLYAVKTLVFDNGKMTVGSLRQILDANFEGHEDLRLRALHAITKYGNDDDAIDDLFGRIIQHILEECQKYTAVFDNSQLIPSVFCWVMHELFGRQTGATPDGRPAGFPLGDGSGPCQGREMCGPTASILSSTKWPHHGLIGGVAVNMKFSKATFGAASFAVMKGLIKTYLQRGGFELQINVLDGEKLKKAQERPEEYKDLVVRIGGYSDYFVRLSPEMQAEVILRTEHTI